MSLYDPSKILIFAPQTLGESVTALPAIQQLKAEEPALHITVLAEASLQAFWEMVPAMDVFQTLEKNRPTVGTIRAANYTRASLMNESLRAALLPWRAGIKRRAGFSNRWTKMLLTDVVHRPTGHRQFAAMNLLDLRGDPPAPQIEIPHAAFQTLERKITHLPNLGTKRSILFQALEAERPVGARPVITLLPGGAGPHWPDAHFALLAKNLASSLQALVLIAGDAGDAERCGAIAELAGENVHNLSGKTTLQEFSALLSISDAVVSGGNGGAHLAAVVGASTLVVSGPADSEKDAPLGNVKLLDKKKPHVSGELEFEEVSRVLTAVPPDVAYDAVTKSVQK
jgi:heptosyltransferase-2